MEKLSRAEKYKEYRNSIQNDSEKDIKTDELKDLRRRLVEVEKKFGNTSKTEYDFNRGYKSSSAFDAYDIFSDQTPQQQPIVDQSRINNEAEQEINNYQNDALIGNRAGNEQPKERNLDDMLRSIVNKSLEEKKDRQVDDYITKIKNLLNDDDQEETKPFGKRAEKQNEGIAPFFSNEPEYIPSSKSDTDSIPSVEKLLYEINKVQTKDEDAQTSDQKFAEFVEERRLRRSDSVLKDVKLEKPVIKPIVPVEDHSKEFNELCEGVNKLAKEIDSSIELANAPSVAPSPAKPISPSKPENNDTKKDNNVDSSINNFMDDLKKEVSAYNESVENITIDTLKDNLIDEHRHAPETEVKEEPKEEIKETNKDFEATVHTEVNKILKEINDTKADNISAADVIKNVDTVVPEITDLQQGKTIAFDTDELVEEKKNNKENTIVLSEPYNDQGANNASVHTMSFEAEELYESDEKSSKVLNIILTILIVLAVVALGVIAYFFLLTRGII